ncbi:Hypothetical predicted protein [Olea europaea subsp. europaea]|uniref:Uncharacterized protein n=1 Tax=Olea europaea subsp. europaea TaxID=158383 RepID=A0A8S0UHH1_OLEEU|nr:Hypothetical predicted protein [Olea europaea subsp. europaea]
MEFEFMILEDARLRAHIFQQSNLKYVKTVMDHFDERQREDFRNSPLGVASQENYMHGARLPHYYAGLGLGGNFRDWGTLRSLHVYATLRSTDAEVEQPYFSTLVTYDDPLMPVLDDIARTSGSDRDGDDSEEHDGDDSKDTGKSSTSPATPVSSPVRGPMTQTRPVGTSASSLIRGEVEELLLDQRILFEMQLWTVKLEIQQYVTSECIRLREFIVVLVAPLVPTTALGSTGANVEIDVSGSSPQDVHGQDTEPLPTPIDIGVDTGRSQPLDGADIASCSDDDHEPLPTLIDHPQDGGATEPSHATKVGEAEFDGCNMTDGEGKFIACVTSAYDTFA